MNDPFDPYFEFVTDFEGRYPAILSWIEANHGAKEVRWFKSVMPYQSWRNSLSGIKKRNANLKENSFLLCASAPLADLEPAHNLYMWGHYCSGHRGGRSSLTPKGSRPAWSSTRLRIIQTGQRISAFGPP
jgi:hypothetical protein